MSSNIQSTAFTATTPPSIAALRNAQIGDGCVTYLAGTSPSRPLYEVKSIAKQRTIKMLVSYSLDRLASFGIPDLDSWNAEVCELDYEYFQVEFRNIKGATIGVQGILLNANKSGVSVDHGIYASQR